MTDADLSLSISPEVSPRVRELLADRSREGELARRICRELAEKSGVGNPGNFLFFKGDNCTTCSIGIISLKGYDHRLVNEVLYSLKNEGLIDIGRGAWGNCWYGFKREMKHDPNARPNSEGVVLDYIYPDVAFREEIKKLAA